VVRRDFRGVDQGGPFAQDLYARAGLTTDDRTTGPATKGIGVHTGQAGQGIAKGGTAAVDKVFAAQEGYVAGDIITSTAQRQGAYHNLLDLGDVIVWVNALRGGLRMGCTSAEGQQGYGEQKGFGRHGHHRLELRSCCYVILYHHASAVF